MCRELSNLDSSAIAIITRPPEVVACLKLKLKLAQNVFVIFDSHPRPYYPNGGGMIASTSIEGTASRLTEILHVIHLADNFLRRLATNYSGHVFVPHVVETSTPTLSQAVFEPGLTESSMQAEISKLRSQNEFLKREQQRLESKTKEVDALDRRQKRRIRQQEKEQIGSSSGPSKHFDRPSAPPRHYSSSSRHSSRPLSSIASTSTTNPFGPDSPSTRSSSIRPLPPIPISSREDKLDSVRYAMRLQHEYDNEDQALFIHRAELSRFTRRLFTCGICLEEMPDDSIACPDPCRHTFCRECLREYVTTRLNERRFPIQCPTCVASNDTRQGLAGGKCREQIVNSQPAHYRLTSWFR